MDLKKETKDYIAKLSALEERLKSQGLSIADTAATTVSSNINSNVLSRDNAFPSSNGAALGGSTEVKVRRTVFGLHNISPATSRAKG